METIRFVQLAELLGQIIFELTDVNDFTPADKEYSRDDCDIIYHKCIIPLKLPRSLILKTAKALKKDYEDGLIQEDEEGQLYYVGMIEDYCGEYYTHIDKKITAFAKKYNLKNLLETKTVDIDYSKMGFWMEQLLPIVMEYKDGDTDPLDGDGVDDLCKIIKAKINLHEGNITQEEYEKILN